MSGTGQRFFDKRQELINILNKYKDENGISKITRTEIESIMKLSTTSVNNTIKSINDDAKEQVIKHYNEWYIVKIKEIWEIPKYQLYIKIIKDILEDNNLINENEYKMAEKYKTDRKTIQTIKTILKEW